MKMFKESRIQTTRSILKEPLKDIFHLPFQERRGL